MRRHGAVHAVVQAYRQASVKFHPLGIEPFKTRRCPATGWYEWQKTGAKSKTPFHFRPKATPFAFAGVYDIWKGDGGRAITSFAIVTTDAATSTRQYHDRMLLVLDESQFDDWMRAPADVAAGTMKPYAGAIEAWEVSSAVGNVRNDRPDLIERAGLF